MSKKNTNLELLLFLLENAKDISDMTEMKVYKLLYFLDKEYFLKFGKKITTWMTKNTYGPVFSGLRKEKQFDEYIKLTKKWKKHFYHLKNKDVCLSFSEEQRKTLLSALERYKRLKASELVKLSHSEAPFLMAENWGEIDMENVKYNEVLEQEEQEKRQEQCLGFTQDEVHTLASHLQAKYG